VGEPTWEIECDNSQLVAALYKVPNFHINHGEAGHEVYIGVIVLLAKERYLILE
jgi:hypothetical protein